MLYLNTVKVNKLFDIESFASVHHMVSTINGTLNHIGPTRNLAVREREIKRKEIDIDFELLPTNQRENLVLFMEELSFAFHLEI